MQYLGGLLLRFKTISLCLAATIAYITGTIEAPQAMQLLIPKPKSEVLLGDNLKVMREFPDNYFDWAVIDPPIGKNRTEGVGKYGRQKQAGKLQKWDEKPPPKKFWQELFRISKNQVIWCAQYYTLPASRGWLVWDKGEGFYNRDFAECELAWTSLDMNVRKFRYDPLARGDYRNKIHPCQKPVSLYEWTYEACGIKPGMRLIDTHVGSGSSRIAAHYAGIEYLGIEADTEHFMDQETRYHTEIKAPRLIAVPPSIQPIQQTIL